MKVDRKELVCHLADETGMALCILRTPAQIVAAESDLEAVLRCAASLRKRIATLRRKVAKVEGQRHVPVASAVGETKCDDCLGVLDRFPQIRNKAATAEHHHEQKRRARVA